MAQEEEVLGKAYDGRLMRRLLGYLRPYKWQVVIALVAIVLKAGADVLGPYLTKTAIDKYLSTASAHNHTFLDGILSSKPLVGIAELGAVYFALLLIGFGLDYTQIYLMQWTGQKVMFDLRSQIYRHLQHMHIGFYDKNPVGRLVTRVTSDVDALSEMFTSGVVAIFENVFVLVFILAIMLRMKWWLALITFAVLPFIFWATMIFRKSVRDSYRRIRTAIARINSYLQEHVTGMVVLQLFNREKRAYRSFDKVNAQHMDAFKDAIMAYALYYPVVEILSSVAIALVIWFGGMGVLRGAVTIGILTAFMQYAQRFFRPIQDLSDKYNILQAAMASSERVFKLLDTPIEITSPAQPQEATGAGRIEFDHVWFSYRQMDTADENQQAFTVTGNGHGATNQVLVRQMLIPLTGSCAMSHSPSSPEKAWPLWATPAREKRRSSPCSCAFTIFKKALSGLTASIYATWSSTLFAAVLAWYCRTHFCSAGPLKTTFASALNGLPTSRFWPRQKT